MKNFPTHIVATGAFVTNKEGKVLLIKEPKRGWVFPGGQVENGESVTEGILREIEEESGLKCKIVGLIGIYSNITNPRIVGDIQVPTMVIIDFRCEYISGDLKTSKESLELGWYTIEEAKLMIKHEKNKYRFENMINKKNNVYCYSFEEPLEFIEKYIFEQS